MPNGSNSTIILMSYLQLDLINILEDQTKDILYNIIPRHWKSYMQQAKFDTIQCSVQDFFDMMECYQVADQLDPSLKQNQSKTNKNKTKKLMEKSNNKKCKAMPKKNDSDLPVPKKACMQHGPDSSHMSDECQTLQQQANQKKEA
jgi:hypothetical protein